MLAFLSAVLFAIMSEMGDKTQLVALAFACKYRPLTVLAGIAMACLLLQALAVVVGASLAALIPLTPLHILAGLSFIAFGVWTLRGESEELDEKPEKEVRLGAFFTVFITFFLSEMGDKTQLLTVTLATEFGDLWCLWAGSTLGMVISDGSAILVGLCLGKKLPAKQIKYGAVVIFFLAGIWTLADALGLMPL